MRVRATDCYKTFTSVTSVYLSMNCLHFFFVVLLESQFWGLWQFEHAFVIDDVEMSPHMKHGTASLTRLHIRPAKTQTSLCVRVESLLCVLWIAKNSNHLYATSEDSDQIARMRRMIRYIAGRTCKIVEIAVSRLMFISCESCTIMKINLMLREHIINIILI